MVFGQYCIEVVCWDNESDEIAAAEASAASDAAAAAAAVDASKKTFTQDELNKIVTSRVKGLQTQLKQTEGNYQTLLEQQGLSEGQRTAIEADLENVRAQMRTKEQQIAHDRKKEQEKYQGDLKKSTEAADYYKSLYETSTVERAIVDAAIKHEAYDTDQFVGLLRDRTKLVEELDNNSQKTGRLVPKVQWDVMNPETKQTERVLKDPAEIVELMKETPKWQNLFKSNVARGVGGGNSVGQQRGRADIKSMTATEYMAYRNSPEGAQALGLKLVK